jgi:hypothetical protein
VKTDIFCDARGMDTLQNLYYWAAWVNKWIVTSRIENKFDSTSNKVLRVDYSLDKESGNWGFVCKYSFTYNKLKNMTSQKYYYWNPVSKRFENYSITEFEYNNDTIQQQFHQQWLFSTKTWFLDNRITYYYDKLGS